MAGGAVRTAAKTAEGAGASVNTGIRLSQIRKTRRVLGVLISPVSKSATSAPVKRRKAASMSAASVPFPPPPRARRGRMRVQKQKTRNDHGKLVAPRDVQLSAHEQRLIPNRERVANRRRCYSSWPNAARIVIFDPRKDR